MTDRDREQVRAIALVALALFVSALAATLSGCGAWEDVKSDTVRDWRKLEGS